MADDDGGTVLGFNDPNLSNWPTPGGGTTNPLWVRITCDGTNVVVKGIVAASAPSDGTWSGTSAAYDSDEFDIAGGSIGLGRFVYDARIDNLTVKTDRDPPQGSGSYETTEHVDQFCTWGGPYTEAFARVGMNSGGVAGPETHPDTPFLSLQCPVIPDRWRSWLARFGGQEVVSSNLTSPIDRKT
ncbi:MAG: hypothetical protein WD042_11220, partial [Phycisphaeraceae bacterium]